MISLADAIKDGLVKRELSDDEQWAVSEILDAARDWADGSFPLYLFAEVGKLPAYDSHNRRVDSAGYGRALALMVTPKDDPRWESLNRAIGALVDLQDIVRTKQGIFPRSLLHAYGVTVR